MAFNGVTVGGSDSNNARGAGPRAGGRRRDLDTGTAEAGGQHAIDGCLDSGGKREADRWGFYSSSRRDQRGANRFKWFQTISKLFKFHLIQKGPSQLKKFEIKYGFEGFDERNNFSYKNVLRFEVDFELNFREASKVWI
jgi:hypothetical protein